ncbi:hypothetical protein [Streptomyces bungoensis]|uniref:hypothetical protein n=1 Tax=Streptomyces bungoensis TaxID=285568 RepID=UPI003F557ADC
MVQLQSFWDYRRLRKLERSGVEGEATVVRRHPVRGHERYFLAVKLPDGSSADEFSEEHWQPIGAPGAVLPVIYDPAQPKRATTGARKDIDYKAERFAVYVMGGGGLTLFVAGCVMVALVRPW